MLFQVWNWNATTIEFYANVWKHKNKKSKIAGKRVSLLADFIQRIQMKNYKILNAAAKKHHQIEKKRAESIK